MKPEKTLGREHGAEAARSTQNTHASSKLGAAWQAGGGQAGMSKPTMHATRRPTTSSDNTQTRELLPCTRDIAQQLGHQEQTMRAELLPLYNELGTLVDALPTGSVGHHKAQFILECIERMLGEAAEARQWAEQAIVDMESALQRGN